MGTRRLLSLDTFRGFTIAAMILVNFPGNWDYVFSPLQHTRWNGISFTDLIAPFFLFIVGISIALSYTRRLADGVPVKTMYTKLFTRALKLYAVGMFLNILGIIDNFSFAELRWTGTLHRIAIVFLVCGLLFLHWCYMELGFPSQRKPLDQFVRPFHFRPGCNDPCRMHFPDRYSSIQEIC